MWWRNAFLTARTEAISLKIGAIEPELRFEYLSLTADRQFSVFPIPHDGSPIASQKCQLQTIGIFGHQRNEKGIAVIFALAEALLKTGFNVIVQDSGNSARHWPSGVTKLGFQSDFPAQMAQSDLIVLPYPPENYRRKGSGIAWEALATGVPVVAPFDTGPSRMLERYETGEFFVNHTAQDIYHAIMRAKKRYHQLSSSAFSASTEWAKINGTKRFIDAMTGTFEPGRSD